MFRAVQTHLPKVLLLGLAWLPGCAAQHAAVSPAVAGKAFSLDTPVERIAADPRGKALLKRDLPGLMSNRSYMLFEDMSLSQIAEVSGGQLTQSKLDVVEADLVKLNALENAGS
jgi:hypothetical protein